MSKPSKIMSIPAFQEGAREAGVPNEVVGVERLVGVARTGVEAEVG